MSPTFSRSPNPRPRTARAGRPAISAQPEEIPSPCASVACNRAVNDREARVRRWRARRPPVEAPSAMSDDRKCLTLPDLQLATCPGYRSAMPRSGVRADTGRTRGGHPVTTDYAMSWLKTDTRPHPRGRTRRPGRADTRPAPAAELSSVPRQRAWSWPGAGQCGRGPTSPGFREAASGGADDLCRLRRSRRWPSAWCSQKPHRSVDATRCEFDAGLAPPRPAIQER